MYERMQDEMLTRPRFALRLLVHGAISFGLVAFSIGIGMAGYCGLEGLTPLDGFLNTAMLLGGMGPMHAPVSPAGKLFAGCFALYAGLVFIVSAALLFTPLLHRVMHYFHWEGR
jgi:hypothetical protein